MCSSVASPSTLFPLANTRLRSRYRNVLRKASSSILLTRKFVKPWSCLSMSSAASRLDVSWFPPDRSTGDDYGGWAIVEAPIRKKNKGLPTYVLVSIGASVATLLAVIASFSLSRRGMAIKLSSPLHALYGILRPSMANEAVESKATDYDASTSEPEVPETHEESVSDVAVQTMTLEENPLNREEGKLGRILVPVAVDSTQQEAMLILQKLKIIEDDVKADELCTRREYARWLVRANSLLERNPKHRILPSAALAGSLSAAYSDVHVEDPDFEAIQSLAEAGIIRSRLVGKNSSSDLDDSMNEGSIYFFPERFISRQYLIDWKAQLEYEVVPEMNEKILGSNLGFMDTRAITADASPELFMDMLAGDKSIIRRVFGQGKRFQPTKPSTKAQAAVALTSGRMTEAIYAEISRLDAENSSRQKEMEEIRSELLNKGDIKRYWDHKLDEEKTRAFEVERAYFAEIHILEQDKIFKESTLAEYLRQRAAMDCQKQLLFSLKEEVNEMSDRLALEKAIYTDEQRIVQDKLSDSQVTLEGMLDAKSILEAEIEALRILRSWIEDEARKSQARAKVLEEVGRRWKWDA